MITLYQFSPTWGLPNVSPFCLKLETYLKLAKLPYQNRYIGDPRKTPKGKLPFIKDDNKVIADSSIIIDYLKATYGDSLDNELSATQNAQRLAIQRLIEEHLYWVMVYSRWIDEPGWNIVKKDFFARLPKYLKWFLVPLIRKKIINTLYAHGIGRHNQDEIYQMGCNDINAISILLADKNYFFGDKPTSIDATLYGFIANIIDVPVESPLKQYTLSKQNLVEYCKRMSRLG